MILGTITSYYLQRIYPNEHISISVIFLGNRFLREMHAFDLIQTCIHS